VKQELVQTVLTIGAGFLVRCRLDLGRKRPSVADFNIAVASPHPVKTANDFGKSAASAHDCAGHCAAASLAGRPQFVWTAASDMAPWARLLMSGGFDQRHLRSPHGCRYSFCGVPLSSTRVAIHSVIPIARKTFQRPSGSFLSTASSVPRTCVGSPPGNATEAVK
jgi:hypothetical protein